MTECIIEVEKVFQSPSTPIVEVDYLVKIYMPEHAANFEKELLEFLEKKSNLLVKQTMPM